MKKDYTKKYHFKKDHLIWSTLWPSLLYLGLSISISIIGVIIAAIFLTIKNMDINELTKSGTFILSLTLITQILTIAICLPIFLYNREHYYPKPKSKPTFLFIILAILFFICVTTPFNLLLSSINDNIDSTTGVDIVNQIFESAPLFLTIISGAILAPITEELMLRGLTLNKLLSKKSALVSILITSILFGILHFNIIQGLFAIIAGICLAYIYLKTKSLSVCIICHIVNNLIATIELYFTDKTNIIISIILFVIAIVPTYYFINKKEIDFE